MGQPNSLVIYQQDGTINKVFDLPFPSLAAGLVGILLPFALACGGPETSAEPRAKDFWINASVEDVQAELDRGADIHARSVGGFTPLHDAARGNDSGVVALLLYEGADLHAKSDNGLTPLHMAAWENEDDVISLLLDHVKGGVKVGRVGGRLLSIGD